MAGPSEKEKKRYREFFLNSRDGYVVVSPEGRIIDANPAYCEMLGYTLEELKELNDFYAITPEKWHEWERTEIWENRLLKEGYSGIYEKEYIRKNGEVFPVELQSFTVLDEKGETDYLWGIARDISERKEIEITLAEREERYRNLFEKAPLGMFLADEGSTIIDANPTATDILGYTRDEFTGMNASRLIHPDDIKKFPLEDSRKVVKEKGVRTIERKYIAKDGRLLDVEVSLSQLIEENDNERNIFMFRDISERKKFINALKESETKARAILDASPVAIVLLDRGGTILDTNAEHAARFKMNREEMLGKCVWDLLPGSVNTHRKEQVERVFDKGESYQGEDERDGVWNEYHIEPVRFEKGGRVKAVVVEALDITERKRASEELNRNRELLKRTQELAMLGGWEWDVEEKRAIWTDEVYRIYGVGKDFDTSDLDFITSFIHKDNREELIQAFENCINKGRPYDMEVRFTNANGKELWCRSLGEPVYKNGSIVKVRGYFQEISKRKQAEEKLRKEKELIEIITSTSPIGITFVDPDGNIKFANYEAEKILGLKRRKIETMSYDYPKWRICNIDGGEFKKADLPFSIVKRTEKPVYGIQHAIEYPDGKRIFLSINGSPLFNADGIFDGMVASIEDITERRKAEVALGQVKKSYEAIFNSSTDCIFVHDSKTGKILDVNQTTMDTFGYSKEEILKLNVGDLSLNKPPFTQKEAAAYIKKAVREGPQFFEWLAKKKNGELIWFENSLQYTELAGEKRVLVIGRDIDERKKAEKILVRSEREKNLILNTTKEMFAYYDLDLKIQWVNKASADSMGLQPDDMIGKHCYEFWNQSDKPCNDCPVLLAKRTKEPQKTRRRTPDGRHWLLRGYPVVDEKGDVIALVEFGLDISDSVEAEKNTEKEKERAEFYLDLLGHDLGNIHQGLAGALQLMTRNLDDRKMLKSTLDIANNAVFESLNLTKEVTLLSRIVTEDPEFVEVNIEDTVSRASDLVERLFPEKRIEMETEFEAKNILAEPLLKEVFFNLFHNAVRLQGYDPWLRVRSAEENEKIVIIVSDKGPGIQDGQKGNLFRRYGMKGERTRTGLGLSIVQALVDRYGGTIEVRDRVEGDYSQGASFVMTFPKE